MNVGYLLTNAANKFPDRLAIIAEEGRASFNTFNNRTDRLAGAMIKAGLKKGDRAAILFFNSSYFAEAYFATIKAGLVATPVNFRLAQAEMVFILNHSQAKILFYDPEFETCLEGLKEDLETVQCFVSPHLGGSRLSTAYEDFLWSGKDVVVAFPQVCEDDPCQLMYTSGTTGRPKGAVLTHRNIIWNLFNTICGREDQPGEKALIVGPLYHTAALNNHFTIQVALGGTSILVRKFDPEDLLQKIEKEKATIMSGAPTLYNLVMRHPNANKYDVSSVTKCTAGADKLPMETKKRIMEFFPNIKGIYDVYGCTEASPCITILRAKDSLRKDLSVGKALPFLEACVVDSDDRPLPLGEVGEIICRGANVMQGYHQDPAATREAIRDGWLHTGDLARMDEEGFFYIVDRKKDTIVSGGENIYPREIEEVLIRHPAIANVAVVGIPDTDWGEFYRLEKECGVMVMGRRTYKIWGNDFPCKEVVNVVMTSKQHLIEQKTPNNVVFTNKSPKGVIQIIKRKGFTKLFLIGGMKLNTSFFQENLIDEVYLSVHPLLFGMGKTLLNEIDYEKSLRLLDAKKLSKDLV